MTTKWNKNKEGFQSFHIFDDSYFKDCTDYFKNTGFGDFLDGLANIFQYITCPIYHGDQLVEDILKELLKKTHRVPCPETFDNMNTQPLITNNSNYNTVKYFFKDHSDWITTDDIKQNVLDYYSNSFNNEKSKKKNKFTQDDIDTFNNNFNKQLYNPEIINILKNKYSTTKTKSKKEKKEKKEKDKNDKICTTLGDDDIENDAKIIKKELYELLFIPVVLYVTYNIYYIFIHNNIYGNPEVYLTYIKKYYNHFLNIPLEEELTNEEEFKKDPILPITDPTDTKTRETYKAYFFELIWKPYQFLYNALNFLYNFGHSSDVIQNSKFVVFFIIFIFSFLLIYFSGNYFFKMVKSLFTLDTSSIESDYIYTFITGFCYGIILFLFGSWVLNKIVKTGYDAMACPSYFGILFTIFGSIMSIIFRYIIATMSLETSVLICIFYVVFFLILSMKFCSTRGSIYESISSINKSLVDSLSDSSIGKMFKFLYNSIIEISCIIIIIINLSNHGHFNIDFIQQWFLYINILLIVIFGMFIVKDFKRIFFPSPSVPSSDTPSAPLVPPSAPIVPPSAPIVPPSAPVYAPPSAPVYAPPSAPLPNSTN